MDARQALQTREAAAATAWVVYQRNVVGLSIAAICVLAASEPIRREDSGYSIEGGLGRPLAQSTVYRWLAEAREQFREEYIKRPILDMVQEEDERLEHLAAMWMTEARSLDVGTDGRARALDKYLRVLESRRKLLGLDQPTKVQVEGDRAADPAATEVAAMEARAAELRAQQQGLG